MDVLGGMSVLVGCGVDVRGGRSVLVGRGVNVLVGLLVLVGRSVGVLVGLRVLVGRSVGVLVGLTVLVDTGVPVGCSVDVSEAMDVFVGWGSSMVVPPSLWQSGSALSIRRSPSSSLVLKQYSLPPVSGINNTGGTFQRMIESKRIRASGASSVSAKRPASPLA